MLEIPSPRRFVVLHAVRLAWFIPLYKSHLDNFLNTGSRYPTNKLDFLAVDRFFFSSIFFFLLFLCLEFHFQWEIFSKKKEKKNNTHNKIYAFHFSAVWKRIVYEKAFTVFFSVVQHSIWRKREREKKADADNRY